MTGDDESRTTELESDESTDDRDTLQRRILELYRADTIGRTAVGFWLKLCVELGIVVVPTVLIVLIPGIAAVRLDTHPLLTLPRVVGIWASFVVSVTGFTWCFIEATTEE